MTVFHTSDLHLSHRLVAEIRWRRVFLDEPPTSHELITWHDNLLAKNWDEMVKPGDMVLVHGDLSLASTGSGVAAVLDWFAARPGRKQLFPGNHDPVHSMHRDFAKWSQLYHGVFESVALAGRRRLTMPDGTRRNVLCSHFPYTGDRGDDGDRCEQWRLRDCGDWLLHGHLHGNAPFDGSRPKQIDVGMDAWNLTPVSEQTLITEMFTLEGLLGW